MDIKNLVEYVFVLIEYPIWLLSRMEIYSLVLKSVIESPKRMYHFYLVGNTWKCWYKDKQGSAIYTTCVFKCTPYEQFYVFMLEICCITL